MASPKDDSWHREQVIRAARGLLDHGCTIEDALDCVLEAGRRQWGLRIICTIPATLRIDGHSYSWPDQGEGHA